MRPLLISREAVAHGTFVKTDSAPLIEILGATGLDFAVIDAEHAPFDRASLDRLLLAGRAAGLPLLVRVPDAQASTILSVLDMGAAGILVPHVDSADQARAVVARAKFRNGERGFSSGPRAAGYGALARDEVLARADACAVVCQIESRAALDEVAGIADVPGVDALFIGRADLALSLGLADARAPEMVQAVSRIAAAARAAGKVCGMHVADAQEAGRFAGEGITWFVISSDQGLLQKAVRGIARDGSPSFPPSLPAFPSHSQQMQIRLELEALNAEFAFLIDHGPAEDVAGLFTENGSYGRIDGMRSHGREAIRATYAARAGHGERTARHVFTNLRLVFEADGAVRGTTIQTLYAEDGPPPHPAQVLAVSDFDDVYERDAQGRWRYASRTITSLFVDAGGRKTVLPFRQAKAS